MHCGSQARTRPGVLLTVSLPAAYRTEPASLPAERCSKLQSSAAQPPTPASVVQLQPPAHELVKPDLTALCHPPAEANEELCVRRTCCICSRKSFSSASLACRNVLSCRSCATHREEARHQQNDIREDASAFDKGREAAMMCVLSDR